MTGASVWIYIKRLFDDFSFYPGADPEQEGGCEQGDLQMWLQGQHQTQARFDF